MHEGNIKKYYLFSFLYNTYLWLPVWVLFLLDMGFSLTQITFLDTFFFVTIVILSLPVGMLSDRIGRKSTLSLGAIFTSVALFLFAESETFSAVAVSYLFWACALTFISVGGTAFLYDTLKMIGREEEFKKINGRSIFFATAAMGIASLIGGRMGEFSLKLPILISSAICLLSFLVTLTFKEPLATSIDKSYVRHLKESILITKNSSSLAFLIGFGIVFSILISISQIFSQPYFKLLGIRVTSIGTIYFVFKFFVAISASSAHVIETRIGERRTLAFMPAFLFLCLFFLSSNMQVIPAFLFLNMVAGFAQPLLNDYINRRIPTERRATIISLQTGLLASIQLFAEPAMGYVADRFSLQTSFSIMTGFCFLLLISAILSQRLFGER